MLVVVVARSSTRDTTTTSPNADAEGLSVLDERGIVVARSLATLDARRSAAMAASVHIESSEIKTADGIPVSSSRIRPEYDVTGIQVTREWQSGGNEHVVVSTNAPSSRPRLNAGNYKRKIAIGQFLIKDTTQADDIDDVVDGLPRELARCLAAEGGFLSETNISSPFYKDGGYVPEPDATAIKVIAYRENVQFVVSGKILNLSVTPGLFSVFGVSKRQVNIEIFISDGLTGSVVGRHQFSAAADGDVTVGADKPFGSAAFYDTTVGRTVQAAITSFVASIVSDVSHLPFSAHILRVNGAQLTLDVGATSLIEPGDTLLVYHRLPEWIQSEAGDLSVPEQLIGSVVVNRVMPLSAIGTFTGVADSVAAGDFVRFLSDQ